MNSLNKTDIATFVINCIQYLKTLNKLTLLQAKVQNFKRKAVNISESNISGFTFVINCIQYFKKLNKLTLLQAKVQNFRRKAVNVSESNTSGFTYDCYVSDGVRNPPSSCRFT